MKYSVKPMVSIIVLLNGRDQDLTLSIDSIASQTYRDFELLLVDREDETSKRRDLLKLLDQMSELGVLVRVVGVEASLKSGAMKNKGLQQAKGQLIAFLNPGDHWEPHYLEEIAMLSGMFPQAEAFATSYQWHVNGEQFIDPKIRLTSSAPGPCLLDDYFDSVVKGGQPFVVSSFVGSKKLFESVGFFNANEEAGHEHDLFCRAALYSAIAYSPSVLSFARKEEEDSPVAAFVVKEWSAFVARLKNYAARETETRRRMSVLRYVGAYLLDLASMSVRRRRADIAQHFLDDECCKHLHLRYLWWRFRCWLGSRGL